MAKYDVMLSYRFSPINSRSETKSFTVEAGDAIEAERIAIEHLHKTNPSAVVLASSTLGLDTDG